ncbi:MAG: glycosyltransferase [Armatimonadota bacterium]
MEGRRLKVASSPLVTVLMPVYNCRDSVARTMDSVLAQTLENFEFLIMNDSSTDNTRDVVLSYADPRIRLIDNATNLGCGPSLAAGLQESRGEYVCRIDADDTCTPHRLAAQVKALEQSGANVCFCRATFHNDVDGTSRKWAEIDWDRACWHGLFGCSYGLHPALMFRRLPVVSIGGYDRSFRYSQDYDLYDRLVAKGERFIYLPDLLVDYHFNERSVSVRRKEEQDQFARQVSSRAIRRLLPDAAVEEAQGLRWLFVERENLGAGYIGAALPAVERLIASFCRHQNVSADCSWLLRDVAVCLAAKMHQVKSWPDRKKILSLITRFIIRSRSPRTALSCLRAGIRSTLGNEDI